MSGRKSYEEFLERKSYEEFLDLQILRQRAVWFQCLPSVMSDLVIAINQIKPAISDPVKAERFNSVTLPKLREMYKELRELSKGSNADHEQEMRTRELVKLIISQINGWYRSSRVAVGLKREMDPRYSGNGVIAKSYHLLISDDFGVTVERGW